MRTIRTKLYKFSELSTEAKKVAIKWYQKHLDNDSDILYGFEDHCAMKADEIGLNDATVRYSLSWSQGDGLSLSAKLDFDKFISEAFPNIKKSVQKVITDNVTCTIKANNGHYAYASTGDIEFYLDAPKDYPNIEKLVNEVRNSLEQQYMSLCNELEKDGYKWLEDAYTDERAIEAIEANTWEFLKDGSYYRY